MQDVGYTYTYYYGNGDNYSGYGYADAYQGYSAGQIIYKYNETGNWGYYYISSTTNYGYDYGLEGQVYISNYYDSESGNYASKLSTDTG